MEKNNTSYESGGDSWGAFANKGLDLFTTAMMGDTAYKRQRQDTQDLYKYRIQGQQMAVESNKNLINTVMLGLAGLIALTAITKTVLGD